MTTTAGYVSPVDFDHLLGSYWTMGDVDHLGELFAEAGMRLTATRRHVGTRPVRLDR